MTLNANFHTQWGYTKAKLPYCTKNPHEIQKIALHVDKVTHWAAVCVKTIDPMIVFPSQKSNLSMVIDIRDSRLIVTTLTGKNWL